MPWFIKTEPFRVPHAEVRPHLEAPRGEGGFGYDPVFFVPEAHQTFAEMDHGRKAELGHRGRAFALLRPRLQALLAGT